MEFIKSFFLPLVFLALLFPTANQAVDLKTGLQNAVKQTREFAGSTYEAAQNKIAQMPSFNQMRAIIAKKLGLQKKGFSSAIADAKDALITYSIDHPYVALAAVITLAFGTGFWVARKLYKPKKTRNYPYNSI
jgi:hypothetical protein